jgi:hypothetical protein
MMRWVEIAVAAWGPMQSNSDPLSSFIRFIQLKSLRARTQESYLTWVRRVTESIPAKMESARPAQRPHAPLALRLFECRSQTQTRAPAPDPRRSPTANSAAYGSPQPHLPLLQQTHASEQTSGGPAALA